MFETSEEGGNQQRIMKELFRLVDQAIMQVMRQKKLLVCSENYEIQRMLLKY